MSAPAIVAEALGKDYWVGEYDASTLREAIYGALASLTRRRPAGGRRVRHALRDVSFSVEHGELVGVVGMNGAGKSTLLKLLTGVTEPTSGQATLHGRVASLLEVGTGFHPELTGRENVFLNGAILGMRRAEVARKLDQIVAFAEVEEYLDTPVKRYSSGMHTRLAFAVAAHLDADVMIVDEVLAVGDIAFQRKCITTMTEITASGRTVLFVSHNLGSLRTLCQRGLLLDRGRLVADSSIESVLNTYVARMSAGGSGGSAWLGREQPQQRMYFTRAQLVGEASPGVVHFGKDVEVELDWTLRGAERGVVIEVVLSRDGSPVLSTFNVDTDPAALETQAAGRYTSRVTLPTSRLKEGTYAVDITLRTPRACESRVSPFCHFQIENISEDTTHTSDHRDAPGFVRTQQAWVTELVTDDLSPASGPPPRDDD